ncbi:hypothetical protein N7471_007855 [Penicillium samsonianum]|uniref:uncharacterized protein n=1 Tax=Penicillium samsonianum TaxID=1882272 RepID=UPI002546824F|nr:uncharacterized protein N7471_007855 [Penicillium samsonianum]KAJ6132640.1 hypothetical protein N7471_007855 [Penicillium samsonianum]
MLWLSYGSTTWLVDGKMLKRAIHDHRPLEPSQGSKFIGRSLQPSEATFPPGYLTTLSWAVLEIARPKFHHLHPSMFLNGKSWRGPGLRAEEHSDFPEEGINTSEIAVLCFVQV